MKRIFLVFTVLFFALRLPAQTNAPARLALIAESADTSAAVDVLTAQLSGSKNLQLLERNEIEKVYREHGLSAENKDYVKLGQILGADGLLLMETAKEGTNQFLNIRLIAVKPGVVVIAEKFSWPVANLTEWSAVFENHLNPLLPKLTVLVKDAIPNSQQMRMDPSPPGDPRQMFKTKVESYWQNPSGVTNRPPLNKMVPGAGVVPNRIPATQ